MEGLQDINQSVELLIRLLCAVPGWSEKNVQVFYLFDFARQIYHWLCCKVIKTCILSYAGSATGN